MSSGFEEFQDLAEGPALRPSAFRPGEFSYGAEIAKLGTTLIASSRANRAYARAVEKDALAKEYQQAQIDNLRSEIAARRTRGTYALDLPGQALPGGVAGPPQPETVTFDNPNDYSQERARWYPPPKVDAGPTAYQQELLDISRQRLALGRNREARIGQSNNEWRAADSELTSIDEESKRYFEKGRRASLANAAFLRAQAIRGRGGPRDEARRALGVDAGDPDPVVEAAAAQWAARQEARLRNQANERLDPQRNRARAIMRRHANLPENSGPSEFDQLIQAIEGATQ